MSSEPKGLQSLGATGVSMAESNMERVKHPYIVGTTIEGRLRELLRVKGRTSHPSLPRKTSERAIKQSANGSELPHGHIRPHSHLTTIPTEHAKTVRSIAWSPSGKTLATGSFDADIRIWEHTEASEDDDESEEWECIGFLSGHKTECKSVAYSDTGPLFATCSRDKTAERRVQSWFLLPLTWFPCPGYARRGVLILASGSYDDTVKLYIDHSDEDWLCFAALTGHTRTVWSVAWVPRDDYLASSSDDLTIRI
ncbi:WD40 repeat-like protein [Imleria badia]|nr:WD40 repeat-like protein [Imleria badia]